MLNFFKFFRKDGQLLIIGTERYFLFKSSKGSEHMISDKCPHRGGPLSKGDWDPISCKLKCPWHKNAFSEKTLLNKELPTVKAGNYISIYIETVDDNYQCRMHNTRVASSLTM